MILWNFWTLERMKYIAPMAAQIFPSKNHWNWDKWFQFFFSELFDRLKVCEQVCDSLSLFRFFFSLSHFLSFLRFCRKTVWSKLMSIYFFRVVDGDIVRRRHRGVFLFSLLCAQEKCDYFAEVNKTKPKSKTTEWKEKEKKEKRKTNAEAERPETTRININSIEMG